LHVLSNLTFLTPFFSPPPNEALGCAYLFFLDFSLPHLMPLFWDGAQTSVLGFTYRLCRKSPSCVLVFTGPSSSDLVIASLSQFLLPNFSVELLSPFEPLFVLPPKKECWTVFFLFRCSVLFCVRSFFQVGSSRPTSSLVRKSELVVIIRGIFFCFSFFKACFLGWKHNLPSFSLKPFLYWHLSPLQFFFLVFEMRFALALFVLHLFVTKCLLNDYAFPNHSRFSFPPQPNIRPSWLSSRCFRPFFNFSPPLLFFFLSPFPHSLFLLLSLYRCGGPSDMLFEFPLPTPFYVFFLSTPRFFP